jgi:MFS family permease
MSGVLQGSWGLGFALSALAYGFLFDLIGWRGLLWIGILPALIVLWIRFYVNEPEVWVENKRRQREIKAEVKAFVQYADGLLLDSQHFLRLLFDLGLVLGILAEGTELDAADGGHADVLGQHHRLCRQ